MHEILMKPPLRMALAYLSQVFTAHTQLHIIPCFAANQIIETVKHDHITRLVRKKNILSMSYSEIYKVIICIVKWYRCLTYLGNSVVFTYEVTAINVATTPVLHYFSWRRKHHFFSLTNLYSIFRFLAILSSRWRLKFPLTNNLIIICIVVSSCCCSECLHLC